MALKKLKFALKAYSLLALFSLVTYACCEQETFQLVGIESSILQDIDAQKIYNSGEEALITGQFYAYVNFASEDVASLSDLSPISSTYAFSCPDPIINNPLIPASLKLHFDRDFIFDGDTVRAGTLLNDFEGFEVDEAYLDVSFFAQNAFIEKVEFPDSLYTLNLEVTDNNGKIHRNNWNIRFELN